MQIQLPPIPSLLVLDPMPLPTCEPMQPPEYRPVLLLPDPWLWLRRSPRDPGLAWGDFDTVH